MSNSQRTKGANGEREVARVLRENLGLEVTRNWQAQSAEGGCDLCGIPGWAIEIKRSKSKEGKNAWWEQAAAQAEKAKQTPALIYRIDGVGRGLPESEKWQVVIPMRAVFPDAHKSMLIEMSLKAWIHMLNHTLIPIDEHETILQEQ